MNSAIYCPSGTEKTMPEIPLAAIPSSAVGMLCHYWLVAGNAFITVAQAAYNEGP